MSPAGLAQVIQLVTWTLVVVTGMLALFSLINNFNHPLSKPTSALLLTASVGLAALGWLLGAGYADSALISSPSYRTAGALFVILLPMIHLLGITIALTYLVGKIDVNVTRITKHDLNDNPSSSSDLKRTSAPLQSLWSPYWLIPVLGLIPASIALADLWTGSNLWFTMPDPIALAQGRLPFTVLFAGNYAPLLWPAFLVFPFFATAVIIALRLAHRTDNQGTSDQIQSHQYPGFLSPIAASHRRYAITLLISFVLTGLLGITPPLVLNPYLSWLLIVILPVSMVSILAFRLMAVERTYQRTSLVQRLNLLLLTFCLPILAFSLLYQYSQAQGEFINDAQRSLAQTSQMLTVGILALSVLLLLGLSFLTLRQSLQPVKELTAAAAAVSRGDFSARAAVEGEDELGLLAAAFNSMTQRLEQVIHDQDATITQRTQALERRAGQLQLVADVARDANAIADLEELLNRTVRLISERFSFDHSGIFLLDEAREYAILRAASSPGGQRMLARNHQLRVGSQGIVGYVAASRQPRIALDVGSDAVFFNNPDLPLTRSEAALPLVARGEVIGVLDVQSEQSSAFKTEDVEILRVLADQIALAIDNARLLKESQVALTELEQQYGLALGQAWHTQLGKQTLAFTYDQQGLRPADPVETGFPPAVSDAPQLQLTGESSPYLIQLPIELRGLRIGHLVLRRDQSAGPWQSQERQLAVETLTQMALALENARLLDEVQRRADQEKLVSQIAARIQGSLSLETVMQTAAQEIGKSFRLSEVRLRLNNGHSTISGNQGSGRTGVSPGSVLPATSTENDPEAKR